MNTRKFYICGRNHFVKDANEQKGACFCWNFLGDSVGFSGVFLNRGIKPLSEWSGESWSESCWWYSDIRIFPRCSSEPQHDLSYLGGNWGGFCGFICDISLVCLETVISKICLSPIISADTLINALWVIAKNLLNHAHVHDRLERLASHRFPVTCLKDALESVSFAQI